MFPSRRRSQPAGHNEIANLDNNVVMRSFATYLLLLAALLAGAAAQSRRRVRGPFPARAGEICVICYGVLDSTGLAYLIDGRRFAVDAAESGEFLEDPDAHIKAFDEYQRAEGGTTLLGPGAVIVLAAGALAVVWWRRRRRG